MFDYVLLGQYPSEEDIAATQAGKSTAPIGTPRPIDSVPLPGFSVDSAATPNALGPTPVASGAVSRLRAAMR